MRKSMFALALAMTVSATAFAGGFKSYQEEKKDLIDYRSCHSVKEIDRLYGDGYLFQCEWDEKGLVTHYINETPETYQSVEYIKLTWDDHYKNVLQPVNQGKGSVHSAIEYYLGERYFPKQAAEIRKAFMDGLKDKVFTNDSFKIEIKIRKDKIRYLRVLKITPL